MTLTRTLQIEKLRKELERLHQTARAAAASNARD
jgi:hypothetical protein